MLLILAAVALLQVLVIAAVLYLRGAVIMLHQHHNELVTFLNEQQQAFAIVVRQIPQQQPGGCVPAPQSNHIGTLTAHDLSELQRGVADAVKVS